MKRITGPDQPIVQLQEVKRQLRLDSDEEDLLVQGYIDAATAWVDGLDGVLGRCVVQQTWQASEDEVRCRVTPPDVISETENEDGTIDYVCAMPESGLPVVRQAILMLCAYWYDQRMSSVSTSWSEAPFGVRALLSPIRAWV